MGNNDNLADTTNPNPSSAEASFPDAPFINKHRPTIPADNKTLNPTGTSSSQTSLSTPSQPSYSFPHTARLPPTKPKSQMSSWSMSPNKPAGLSVKEANNTKLTTQDVPTRSKPLAKPASPLSAYQFGSPSSKPTTSNVTVTTSGIVPSTDISDFQSTYNSSSHSSMTETDLTATEAINSTVPKPPAQMTGFDTIVEGDEIDPPVSVRVMCRYTRSPDG